MSEMPHIRLEIESMRYTILHHLSIHHEEVAKAVDEETIKAIKNFDFEGVVADACKSILETEIKRFFEYGEGQKAIREAVSEGLGKIIIEPKES